MLVISQFTLYGDARKGNRPSFTNAAQPELAEDLYNKFISRAKENLGEGKVKAGIFAAMMQVRIINEGVYVNKSRIHVHRPLLTMRVDCIKLIIRGSS